VTPIGARSHQRGQVLVLVTLLLAVLAGFLGLVIDGGGVAAEQQLVRNAADGAALAGGYSIFRQGSSLAAATTTAQLVVVADGLPSGDLAMAYLDAGGVATATPALVRTIRATVTDARKTTFLNVLGIATTQIGAVAQVAGAAGVAAPCALCAMSVSNPGVTLLNGSQLTVTGGSLIVNSTALPNIDVHRVAILTAPSIVEVVDNVSNAGTITPAPVIGSAVADPHPAAPAPSVAGSAVAYTAPASSATITPGVYSQITVGVGAALTLAAGVYVLTGPITMTGGSITGAGVMIYLACSGYPTACPAGTLGAALNFSGGALNLSPPTSGTYAGMTVFADRNNIAPITLASTALTVTGTWYTIGMDLQQTHIGDTLHLGETDVASVSIKNSTVLTVAYLQSQSYGGGTGSGPLSLSL